MTASTATVVIRPQFPGVPSEPAPITLRFRPRRYVDGWAIIDATTGEPLVINGSPQTGFSIGGAQDFANILNRKERGKPSLNVAPVAHRRDLSCAA